jgi:hypothetical protein
MVVFWRHLRSTQLLQSKSAAVSHSIFPALYIISYLTSVCSLVLWTVLGLMFTTDCTLSVFRLKVKMSHPVWYRCLGGVAAPLALRYTPDSGRCQKVSLPGCLTARRPLPSGLALLRCLCWLSLSSSPPHHFISFCNTRWGRVASTSCRSESSNISLVVLCCHEIHFKKFLDVGVVIFGMTTFPTRLVMSSLPYIHA